MTLSDTVADIRYALRQCSRARLRTLLIVLTLSVGIGVPTAVFQFVHGVATRPPAGLAPDPDLVRIRGSQWADIFDDWVGRPLTLPEVVAHEAQHQVFTQVAAWTTETAMVSTGTAESMLASVSYVTDNYFDLLRVRPIAGSVPHGTSAGALESAPVAILSHRLWITRFGAAPDAVGRVLHVDGMPVTIGGVAPPRFMGVGMPPNHPVIWMPLAARPALVRAPAVPLDSLQLYAVARLQRNVSREQGTAAAQLVARRQAPPSRGRPAPSAEVVPVLLLNESPIEGGGFAAGALGGAAVLLLLVVVTNISALYAGAGLARSGEIAVRLSLGASRGRIVRQLLTENLLLAAAGGAVGVLLLAAAARFLAMRESYVDLTLRWPGALVSIGVVLLTGMLCGLVPALNATRTSVGEALKKAGGTRGARSMTLQRRLLVWQVALTQPLLLGLAIVLAVVMQDRRGVSRSPVGEQVVMVRFDWFGSRASDREPTDAVDRLVARLRDTPGIAAVTVQPVAGAGAARLAPEPAADDGRAQAGGAFLAQRHRIVPGYLATMGVRLLRGRDFGPGDTNVVILGNDLAVRLWGDADPVGRRLRTTDTPDRPQSLTVIGVVDAATAGSSADGLEGRQRVYVPGSGEGRVHVLARTVAAAQPMVLQVAGLARAVAPELPLERVLTVAQAERDVRVQRRTTGGIAAATGVVALLLACVGLYGVVAFMVVQGTREIGIRAALGARAGQIVRSFLAQGMRIAVQGLLLGLPLSMIAARVLRVDVATPAITVGAIIAGIVLGVTALATWIPARRAAAVDPMAALRQE